MLNWFQDLFLLAINEMLKQVQHDGYEYCHSHRDDNVFPLLKNNSTSATILAYLQISLITNKPALLFPQNINKSRQTKNPHLEN